MAKKHARLTEEEIVYANNLSNIWSKKKIEFKMKGIKLTQEYAAERMGFDAQGTISQYINGYTPLNDSAVYKFADLLGVNPSEIKPSLTSFVNKRLTGNMSVKESEQDAFGSVTHHKLVPIITWELAKEWKNNILLYNTNLNNSKLIYNPGKGGIYTYVLKVFDKSMSSLIPGEKTYPVDSYIYIDMNKRVAPENQVMAYIMSSNTIVLRSYIEDSGQFWLMPINPQYNKIQVTDDIIICGVCVGKYEDA